MHPELEKYGKFLSEYPPNPTCINRVVCLTCHFKGELGRDSIEINLDWDGDTEGTIDLARKLGRAIESTGVLSNWAIYVQTTLIHLHE